jgi:hypothetical protein
MRASIPAADVARTSVGSIDITTLQIGQTSIDRLVVANVDIHASTGMVSLRNLRLTLTLAMSLGWRVSVTIPFDGSPHWDGTIPFPPTSIDIPFGDVALSGLASLDLSAGPITVTDLHAVVGALQGLHLGALLVEELHALNVVAPRQPFQLTGLGLTSAQVEGIGVPALDVEAITIGHVGGGTVPIADVTIPSLSVPSTSLGTITSNNIDVRAVSNPYVFGADAGVLSVELRITPSVRLQMDELRIENLAASATTGSLEFQQLVLPFDLFGLELSQVGIETIEIPSIEVS